jgi:SAM-dependent methyltransferase
MEKREQKSSAMTSNKKRRRRRATMASQADRHALYEESVQDAPVDAATMGKLYRKFRKKDATVMREDFCGTGLLSTAWVKGKKGRRAVGIDLDEPTLAWGREHHILSLSPEQAKRIQLLRANVLDAKGQKGDIVCALNFSYCIFKERAQLLKYFKAARKSLKPDGIFVLDVLGGTEAMDEDENIHDMGEYTYRWEQAYFNPLTHDFECHIHFEFPDGSEISPAFTYIWRLWTMPELADLLYEAGFSRVRRLWEKTDRKNEATGVFYEPKRVENQESWWTYLVGER